MPPISSKTNTSSFFSGRLRVAAVPVVVVVVPVAVVPVVAVPVVAVPVVAVPVVVVPVVVVRRPQPRPHMRDRRATRNMAH